MAVNHRRGLTDRLADRPLSCADTRYQDEKQIHASDQRLGGVEWLARTKHFLIGNCSVESLNLQLDGDDLVVVAFCACCTSLLHELRTAKL